ncbi:FtsH protease regulator HflK [Phocoenobacter uteri]|uniref:FtsH protease regulator HflK n=1 Tax=Phocoenobacter uteri TaxID=146806 RepID=A0A379C9Q0_9PAST|nr:prohibitin family protein [Phocoenobacter uteri]MDG6880973.1 protease regulator protein HflK [Phocoenobacter uteri]SUB58991.1 FtsH protease regulator HflK [Phocoenobacter uteri]
MNNVLKFLALPFISIIGIVVFISMYSVDAGETAIITRYGEIVDVKTSGLNWKSPVEDITYFSTREQKVQFGKFDDETGDVISGLSAYTSDRQTAVVALTVTYQISNPEEIYAKYKTTENMVNILIAPKVRQQLEIVFSKYSAQTAIEKRGEFSVSLRKSIADVFKGYPMTITDVQSVIQFSKEYEKRIEDSVNRDIEVRNQERVTRIAIEQAKGLEAQAKGQAQAKIIQAEAEAKQRVLRADAEAHEILVKGQAEAKALELKNEALSDNNKLAELTAAERWDGKLPTYIPNGTVLPYISLPQPKIK